MRIRANTKGNTNARRLEIENVKRLILAGATEIPESVKGDPSLADWAIENAGYDRARTLFGRQFIFAMERRLCARLRKAKASDNIFGRYHVMALAKMV